MAGLLIPLYRIGYQKQKEQTRIRAEINYSGKKMYAIFGESEKGYYAIYAGYEHSTTHYSHGAYIPGKAWYNVYYRKDFKTKEEGNAFFISIKEQLSNIRKYNK